MSSSASEVTPTSVLLQDSQDGIVTLTLNRPQQYNALSAELLTALQSALDAIAED